MLYRTTSQTTSNQAIRFISNYNSNIVNYQHQISSGVRLHRSSDDPIAFRQATSLSTQLQQLQTESSAIIDAETKLNTSVSSIQRTHDLIVKAKTLAQQGIQTTSPSERNALAVEVEGMLDSLMDVANSQSAGSYLYSGSRSDHPPFQFGEPTVDGGTLFADYEGSSEASYAFIGASISIETFYVGSEIFGDTQREDMLVFGTTGAKNGTGTDSLVGRASLTVAHTLTTYSGASGVAPGTSSAANDTVIGPAGANTVTINDTSGTGSFGTVQLNNGLEVAWNNSDTDLQVIDDFGREVYLDMSSIAAGFSGSVPFTSEGTISLDDGLTTQAIDFSDSQTLIESTSGGQAHIDSQDISRTGVDHLEFPGTSNIFQVFHELAQDLRNGRDLDSRDYSDALDRRLGELNRLGDHTLATLGQQSASLQTIQELEFRVQDLQLEVETQLNNFQATDVPETVLRLQNDQALLEFTYSVTAQIASTSLLDFLR